MSFIGKTSTKSSSTGANGIPQNTPDQATGGIQLGSSPRPQNNRPKPISLANLSPLRFIHTIEEEPEYATAKIPSDVNAQIKPHVEAVRDIVKIRNFGDPINDIPAPIIPGRIYLGAASNAMDIDQLAQLGITAILNCASGSCLTNIEYYNDKDFAYHEFDARDALDYDMSQHLDETIAFYVKCMEENRAILIHCAAGINRSAFIAVYLYMRVTGATFVQAVAHCFTLRPIILANDSFINQLAAVAHREGRL
jgi:protein-tyrosine phosphatase